MFGAVKNNIGEQLFLLTVVSTNNIRPRTYVGTWRECLKKFNEFTEEMDNSTTFQQLIHKEIEEEYGRAKASLRCNRRGFGSDFFKYIFIESLKASNC